MDSIKLNEYVGNDIGPILFKKIKQAKNCSMLLNDLEFTDNNGGVYTKINITPISVVEKNKEKKPKIIAFLAAAYGHCHLFFIWSANGNDSEYKGPADINLGRAKINYIPIKKLTEKFTI